MRIEYSEQFLKDLKRLKNTSSYIGFFLPLRGKRSGPSRWERE
jgi:hypothetical protein